MGASKRAAASTPAPEAEQVPAAEAPTAAEPATPVAETAAPAKGAVTVKFRGENGGPTERAFSKDVHGAEFSKLAKEFSENMQAQGRLIA